MSLHAVLCLLQGFHSFRQCTPLCANQEELTRNPIEIFNVRGCRGESTSYAIPACVAIFGVGSERAAGSLTSSRRH